MVDKDWFIPVNTMAADDLAMQGAKASTASVLADFSASSRRMGNWPNSQTPQCTIPISLTIL